MSAIRHPPFPPRFNGAGRFHARKAIPPPPLSLADLAASMGPGVFTPGRKPKPKHLQGDDPASMGPGVFTPGRGMNRSLLPARKPASMGPGVFTPGRRLRHRSLLAPRRRFNGAGRFHARKVSHGVEPRVLIKLQWGRAFSRPEGRTRSPCQLSSGRLQWGRAFSRPEGRSALHADLSLDELQWGRAFSRPEGSIPKWGQRTNERFNGAGRFHARKVREPAVLRTPCRLASMGPGVFTPGRAG